ncbi:MAG: PAS domain S-box protein [Phycisphaeraceae bacterium]
MGMLPDALLVVNTRGEVLLANDDAARMWKRPSGGEMIGRGLTDLVADEPEHVAQCLRMWSRTTKAMPAVLQRPGENGDGGVAIRVDGGRIGGDETEGPNVLLRCREREDATGPFRILNEKVRDLSEEIGRRRLAEREVYEQREWFETTLGSLGDAVIATDETGRVLFMNPVAEEITGWELAEARGVPCTRVFDIVNESTRQVVESPVTRVLREGVVVGLANHTILIARDGTEHPIDDSGAPIRNGAGDLIGVVLVFRDITDRKEAERNIRESEQRFRIMADASPVMIWVSDETAGCTYFNKPWLDFTGRPMAAEVGEGWTQGVHPEDYERCMATYVAAFRQRETFRMEYRLRRHDGAYRWLLDSGVPRYDEGGAFAGYVGTCIDITERRNAEAQLVSSKDELEARVAERTQQLRKLASQLSHAEQRERRRLAHTLHDNLQQLLAAAKMRLDVLRRREGMSTYAEWTQEVDQLLNQSIQASRSLTVELSPPVLYDAGLGPAIAWLGRRMRDQYGLAVEATTDANAEPVDEDVRVLLFEAVRELLANVVNHSEAKAARVRLELVESEEMVRICVEDDGVGFDSKTLIEEPTEHGFGLFNIRERLDYMGGNMDVKSVKGGGTQVTVMAPLRFETEEDAGGKATATSAAGAAQAVEPQTKVGERTLRVLVVDDHAIVREGLLALLAGHEDIVIVGQASDGLAALALTRELRPDVVVMDVSMPRMNGVEATRLIREEVPGTRVVGLSMHQETELGEAMQQAGAAAYLPKDGPVDELLAAMRGGRRVK